MALAAVGGEAHADDAPPDDATAAEPGADAAAVVELGPEQAITRKLGVWRIDALGIEPELVGRLEALFRMELDRLAASPIPPRRDTERAAGKGLRDCTGEDRCLAAIGKKLGVEVMVTGSVAALGDSYILDVKAVEVAGAKPLRRIATDPLRGSPDELIEAIRVAAYRLLAPEQLHGAISVLSGLVGATVTLDDQVVGTTPLLAPLTRLPLGRHTLALRAPGYEPFVDTVDVRFQKTSRVVVNLISQAPTEPVAPPVTVVRERRAWYARWYVYAAVGAAAVLTGAVVGHAIGKVDVVACPGGASC
ncbi:MAG: PEGA domain-containing protein [Kofleriaceae bacterium]